MSVERECYLLVGNFLNEIFSVNKSLAKEKGEDFPYEQLWEFRNDYLGDMYEGECGFVGYKLLDDYETLDIDPYNSYKKLFEIKDEFEKVTKVKAKIKPVIYSY